MDPYGQLEKMGNSWLYGFLLHGMTPLGMFLLLPFGYRDPRLTQGSFFGILTWGYPRVAVNIIFGNPHGGIPKYIYSAFHPFPILLGTPAAEIKRDHAVRSLINSCD